MKPKLKIIGVGMGGLPLMTGLARAELEAAPRVLATRRVADDFAELNSGIVTGDIGSIRKALACGEDHAVLVSGDAGFFSFSSSLIREFSDIYDIEIINGLNSLQYFCGKLGVRYDDVNTISLHGRGNSIVSAVAYNRRVFALTGGEGAAASALRQLRDAGLSRVKAHVGEALSYPGEKITAGTVAELCERDFSELAVLLLENGEAVSPFSRLRDLDFLRGDAPMTKEAVRTISCARLDVKPKDTVWDVGAGTGAMSVALARMAFEGVVCAVEKEPDALRLLAANRERLGAYNIEIVGAAAPGGLAELPAATKVFIGGSSGTLREVLDVITQKTGDCVVCVNAVTLETLNEAVSGFEETGFSDMEVECVNVAKARKAGRYHLMTAQNPVYVISAVWGEAGGEQ